MVYEYICEYSEHRRCMNEHSILRVVSMNTTTTLGLPRVRYSRSGFRDRRNEGGGAKSRSDQITSVVRNLQLFVNHYYYEASVVRNSYDDEYESYMSSTVAFPAHWIIASNNYTRGGSRTRSVVCDHTVILNILLQYRN